MEAVWNRQIIAESNQTKQVEGNEYFPPDSVRKEFLKESNTQTQCPWKGTASYYHLVVDGKVNEDAAWYYTQPSKAAEEIKNHIAFWKGVQILNE